MEGSKYYGENRYLSSIFQKQERQSKPIKVEETNTPFHFLKRDMNEDEQKQLLQKKIFDNPSLYISTHVLPPPRRSSARFAISTSSSSWPITTPGFTSNRNRGSPKYSRGTPLPTLPPSPDFRHHHIKHGLYHPEEYLGLDIPLE
jgi:hypothetical protein